jgi:hypothetical protein
MAEFLFLALLSISVQVDTSEHFSDGEIAR